MLVSVTGGTGFLGAHSVAEIVRAGHQVRLLVRDESRVAPALAPLGIDGTAIEVHVGDITDPASVSRFVKGADAVVHAAAVYSFDTRRDGELQRTNPMGTDIVLRAALQAGADRVVHVSSVVALIPSTGGAALHPGSPVGVPREAYAASKSAAEHIAREHQAAGAPVVITYPSALLGPHDPHVGDQTARLRNALRGLMPVWPNGGYPVGDVRDTARLLALLVDSSRVGPGRYFGPGSLMTTRGYVQVLREVTGRALPTVFLPATAMLAFGRITGALQRIWPWHIPAEYGAIYTCAQMPRVSLSAPTGDVRRRPIEDTVAETVAWLHAAGLLTDRQAGSQRTISGGAIA